MRDACTPVVPEEDPRTWAGAKDSDAFSLPAKADSWRSSRGGISVSARYATDAFGAWHILLLVPERFEREESMVLRGYRQGKRRKQTALGT